MRCVNRGSDFKEGMISEISLKRLFDRSSYVNFYRLPISEGRLIKRLPFRDKLYKF
jgi:hypothetical protein